MQVGELSLSGLIYFLDFFPECFNIFDRGLFVLDYTILESFCALSQFRKLVLEELLVFI